MGRERNRAGFTLLEAMVAVGIVGVMIALSLPSFGRWQGNQRLNSSVRKVATALAEGRRYAVRTGNNTIVFFGTDTAGATLGGIKRQLYPAAVAALEAGEPSP